MKTLVSRILSKLHVDSHYPNSVAGCTEQNHRGMNMKMRVNTIRMSIPIMLLIKSVLWLFRVDRLDPIEFSGL